MSLLDRWRSRRTPPVPLIDPPGYRLAAKPPPPPPVPSVAEARPVAPRPKAKVSMHLMLEDGSIEELPDAEMKDRAEYLIKSMLPPAPPPPPVSS
jgi:hypothetical protein